MAQGAGASYVWGKMTMMREDMEHNIWWQLKT